MMVLAAIRQMLNSLSLASAFRLLNKVELQTIAGIEFQDRSKAQANSFD